MLSCQLGAKSFCGVQAPFGFITVKSLNRAGETCTLSTLATSGRSFLKSRQRRRMSLIRPQQGQSATAAQGCASTCVCSSRVVEKEPEACLQKGAEAGFMESHWFLIAVLKDQDQVHLGEERG
jgi:hypothetical protein